MKQVCIHCGRQSSGGNLWCLESYCTIDNMPLVLDYGESIADLDIKKALAVLHSATVYEATQGETPVLVKVAHEGFEERLKREARLLALTQEGGVQHPMLPTLLPAHPDADVNQYPYGKTVFREHTRFYTIFAHADGDMLSNMLLKNPQPWYMHVGWITVSLAEVIDVMHRAGKLHLCLSPESVLVRMDKERIPRPMLLDLGAVADAKRVSEQWRPDYLPSAYTAPELLARREGGPATDIYGLGITMYEMLAGMPAYPYQLRSAESVRQSILLNQPTPIKRDDLRAELLQIPQQAISRDYKRRQATASEFAGEMMQHFPPVPREKPPRKFNWRIFWIIMVVLLAIALVLMTAAAVGGRTPPPEDTESVIRWLLSL